MFRPCLPSSKCRSLLLGLCVVAPAAVGGPASTDLLLHLEFENNVLDSSDTATDGVASGGLSYVPGFIGQAAEFDGVDDQVTFPTFADSAISNNDFSVSYWFVFPDLPMSVISKREICNFDPFFDSRTGTPPLVVNMELSDPMDNYSVILAPNRSWQFYTFVRQQIDLLLYHNGRLVDQATTPEVLNLENMAELGISTSPCVTSGFSNTQMLQGMLDDLRIYGRALDECEIGELFIDRILIDGFENVVCSVDQPARR